MNILLKSILSVLFLTNSVWAQEAPAPAQPQENQNEEMIVEFGRQLDRIISRCNPIRTGKKARMKCLIRGIDRILTNFPFAKDLELVQKSCGALATEAKGDSDRNYVDDKYNCLLKGSSFVKDNIYTRSTNYFRNLIYNTCSQIDIGLRGYSCFNSALLYAKTELVAVDDQGHIEKKLDNDLHKASKICNGIDRGESSDNANRCLVKTVGFLKDQAWDHTGTFYIETEASEALDAANKVTAVANLDLKPYFAKEVDLVKVGCEETRNAFSLNFKSVKRTAEVQCFENGLNEIRNRYRSGIIGTINYACGRSEDMSNDQRYSCYKEATTQAKVKTRFGEIVNTMCDATSAWMKKKGQRDCYLDAMVSTGNQDLMDLADEVLSGEAKDDIAFLRETLEQFDYMF